MLAGAGGRESVHDAHHDAVLCDAGMVVDGARDFKEHQERAETDCE